MKQREKKEFWLDPLFVAANSGNGFISFYDDVFARSDIVRRYIIKGGPGTGKSSLMRYVAEEARKKGASVAQYRCSSDPDSLDGIVIDGKFAFLDGTAPHVVEPVLPGVQDEILNLGAFWDADALSQRHQEIVSLCRRKESLYQMAYRYLEICDCLYCVNRSMVLPSLKKEKMERAASRALAEIPNEKESCVRIGLRESIGMKGRVRLDSYERAARKLYWVEDYYETGALFLSALIAESKKKNCSVRVSYHPIHIGEPDAVFFENTGVCFVLGKEKDAPHLTQGVIHMRRFTDPEMLKTIRGRFRENRRSYRSMEEAALDALKEAGKEHFALEQIYVSCMDFQAQKRFVEKQTPRWIRE